MYADENMIANFMTLVCGFEYTYEGGLPQSSRTFPIVGLEPMGGGTKDAEITRLKTDDSEMEGLRVKLAGGQYSEGEKKKKDAGAVIEFICDPALSGLEGLDAEEPKRLIRARAEDEDGDNEGDGDDEDDGPINNGTVPGRSLQFKSFGKADDDTYVLNLNWKTRYACDNYLEERGSSSSHWGFFTWLIVMYFPPSPNVQLTFTTNFFLVSSSAPRHTSSSARGSTITVMEPVAGTFFRTATRSGTFLIFSRTGCGG